MANKEQMKIAEKKRQKIAALTARGMTAKEIGEAIDLTPSYVAQMRCRPDVKQMIEDATRGLAAALPDIVGSHLETIQQAREIGKKKHDESAGTFLARVKYASDYLKLADKKEARLGQSVGLFPAAAPSYTFQTLVLGAGQSMISDGMLSLLGIQEQESAVSDEDIIDVEVLDAE